LLTAVATSDSGTTVEPENPVPATVTCNFAEPKAALFEAVSVSILEPVPGAEIFVGLNAAVTPVGNPLTARLSAEVKPPSAVVASLICTVPPRASDADCGVRVIARPGRETASEAELVELPAAAEMVRFHEPGASGLLGIRVRTLLPAPGEAIDFGVKLAVRPEGSPLTDSEVAALSPPPTVVVTVVVAPVLASATDELESVRVSVGVGAGVGAAAPHAVTNLSASTEPHPVVWSYPAVAVNPVTPGTLLLPVVMSWKTAAPPED